MFPIIAASILSADFSRLGEEVRCIDEAGADWIHIDVMDGNFVGNLTFGAPIIKAIRGYSEKLFDVHLMIHPVRALLDSFIDAGADRISFHASSVSDPVPILEYLHKRRVKAGLAFSPKVSLGVLEGIEKYIDLLLIMGVEPGFGGQEFMTETLPKIAQARRLSAAHNHSMHVQLDGGVTASNAKTLLSAGANVLVAGSAAFSGGVRHYQSNIAALKALPTS